MSLSIFQTFHQRNFVQVIVNQKKEYDMLKLRVPDSRAVYLKFSSDEIPQVQFM